MQDVEFFEPSEISVILNSTENQKHRLQILLMADAGLRVSECTDLKWSECDFKKRLIHVNSLKKRGEKAEIRTIPISARLYEAFANLIEKTKTDQLRGYIFANSDGKPIERGAVNKMLKAIEAKNPQLGNVYPHRLRHSFATNLRSNGAELMDIRDLLGHDKVETSLIYAHANAEQIRNKIEGKRKKTALSWFFGLFQKQKPVHINLTISDSNFVVGRSDELNLIQAHIAKGLHVVLTGPRGIGKTHLLNSIDFGRKVIELDNTKDFKKSLLNIILWLFDDDKEAAATMIMQTRDKSKYEKKLQTESTQNLIAIIKGLVERNEYILRIGDIDEITPAVATNLELLKHHFQIITTSQKLKPATHGFISNFEKVEIKPLDRTNALKMFYRLTDDLTFENQEFTKNKVWEVSEGNPKIIFEIADRLRKEPVLSGEIVEEICNNYLGRSIKEIDLSLFLILVFGGLMVFKFILRSNGDVDARAVGGLISIIFLFGRFFFNRGRRQTI